MKHVEEDLLKDYSPVNKHQLPKLPPSIGGEVHLMIGVKYLRYHPKLIHQLSSGLSIFESPFVSSDGGRGVVGRPHWTFDQVNKNAQHTLQSTTHFCHESMFNSDDVYLLGHQHSDSILNNTMTHFTCANLSSQQRLFKQVESTESKVTFRCRVCKECKHHEEYPAVYQVVKNDTYVDDCMSGAPDTSSSHILADDLEMILNKGGFQMKGVSFSGEDPPEKLTDDGETIHVAGMKWFPKEDNLALNIGELNFSKKTRGKKPSSLINIIPSALTRRHCASKVAEVFDLTGRIAPITVSMKIDLQELVRRKLNRDDTIPDNLRPLWETNFEMMQELRELRFNRAIVPDDAVDLHLNTLDFGDASKSMICSCIYARFKKKDGTFSCQLVLARTKVVPQGMSLPRAE